MLKPENFQREYEILSKILPVVPRAPDANDALGESSRYTLNSPLGY